MRELILAPKNRITQGTIFCGVKSPYTKKNSYGLCITARCDTAREFKASTLSFVNIVSFEEWVEFEAFQKVKSDLVKECTSVIRKLLLEKTNTSVLIDSFGIEKAIEIIESKKNPDLVEVEKTKNFQNAKEKFLESFCVFSRIENIPKNLSIKIKEEVRKLIKGGLGDYFYLEKISNQNDHFNGNGFVALLRSIYSIDRLHALCIPSGMDGSYISKNGLSDRFCHNEDDLVYLIGELKSPYIERVMQNLTLLFGRIGLPDISDDFSGKVINNIGGAAK
ncbi:hypothetical protein M2J84_10660 [Comamonas aquatica]|uniref:hypothetical protein n=1 Tax=Comamonas aquatica TaxID=225991 RepID=UPI0022DDFCFF|nr:hypothetical protein [Comamonas aquatica]WBM40630.1 hypothetical protein M2J84_10660 [Comamonas aquatica]